MSAATAPMGSVADFGIYQKLNRVWHRRALNLFMLIVLAHWAEHLAQAYQVYVLRWPRPQAGGFLGLFFSVARELRAHALRLCDRDAGLVFGHLGEGSPERHVNGGPSLW